MREREVTYITGEAESDLVDRAQHVPRLRPPRDARHDRRVAGIRHPGAVTTRCRRADPAALPAPPSVDDASALPARWLYHTSGSTGDPKGVWHTDASVMAGAYGFVAGYTPGPDDVYPIAFPITHIGGVALVTTSLLSGLRLVLLDVFDAERSPLVMAEHGATFLGQRDPVLPGLPGGAAQARSGAAVPRLRSCVGGGAPNSPELHREVQEVLGGRGVCSSWGLTEFPIATAPSLDDTDEQLSTTEGRPSPGVDIRVVAGDGRECAPGEAGELCLTGPQLMRAYANAELIEDAFDDHGYLRTGDLGMVLPTGHVRITGRLKDVIIRNAENISATEVEGVLHAPSQDGRRRRSSACPTPGPASGVARWCSSPTASTRSRSRKSASTAGRRASPRRRSPSNSRSSTRSRATRWARSGSRSCATATRVDRRSASSALGERPSSTGTTEGSSRARTRHRSSTQMNVPSSSAHAPHGLPAGSPRRGRSDSRYVGCLTRSVPSNGKIGQST